MRLLVLFLVALSVAANCFADESEAIAALRTSGVVVKQKGSGKFASIVLDRDDLSLERLKRLDEVEGITGVLLIDHRHDRDIYLPYLKTIKGVKHLELGGSRQHFTDADMKHVAEMSSLESVYISSDKVTDKGVMEFAKIKGLKKATFSSSRVTQGGRERLNDALPRCVVR